ncbi:TIR domain-containing protein [Aggregatimonas sangjinii]|uniref:TIR domain-containing protein n=1 Tax=Aggregatimonas sangjinii TaxID=2583587 RepID=A0A5B7ST28_9FLAO|nr:TIR domain-containing protein [Aggregatimonas sangjinii]QCW99823.1 TIR domain-containing protein [Aggregatimonas sangjinii]
MNAKKNIYVLYASLDKSLAHDLLRRLQLWEKEFNVSIWHDSPIFPGQQWKPQNLSRLNEADIFLFLLSNGFMYSEFIQQDEFKMIIDKYKEGKAIVVPIVLENCPWDVDFNSDDYDFSFKELPVLPEDGKPINKWDSSEKALAQVTDHVKRMIAPATEDGDAELSQENIADEKTDEIPKEQITLNFGERPDVDNAPKPEDSLLKEAEERRVKEEQKLREKAEIEKRAAEELRLREAAAAEAKKVAEEAESNRIALEEQRIIEEAEAKKMAEEAERLKEEAKAEQKAEAARKALEEQERKKKEEAKRMAVEETRRQQEAAAAKRRAEEEKRIAQEAKDRREAEEQREAALAQERKEEISGSETSDWTDREDVEQSERGTTKKRIGIGLGIAALIALGIVAFSLFNSSPEKPTPTLPRTNNATVADSVQTTESDTEVVSENESISQLGIGDTYSGGLIFVLDPAGNTGKIAYPEDRGPMPWESGNKIHEQLGEGWRLPTLDELRLMYRTIGQGADNSGEFADELYWSATPFDTYQARLLRFSDGNASYHYNKGLATRKFLVRAVRDFSR